MSNLFGLQKGNFFFHAPKGTFFLQAFIHGSCRSKSIRPLPSCFPSCEMWRSSGFRNLYFFFHVCNAEKYPAYSSLIQLERVSYWSSATFLRNQDTWVLSTFPKFWRCDGRSSFSVARFFFQLLPAAATAAVASGHPHQIQSGRVRLLLRFSRTGRSCP